MTDFFAHLADRYRGEADVLQPRVPFRFEPVSAPLAAADLTADAAAERGRSLAYPQLPPRRAGGRGLTDEPGHGPAGDAGRPTAGAEPATTSGPRSARPRQIRLAGEPSEHAADAEPHARNAKDGRIGRADQGRGRAVTSAGAERPEPETPLAESPAARRAASRSAVARPGLGQTGDASAAASAQYLVALRGPTAEPGLLPERHATGSIADRRGAEPAARRPWRPGTGGDPDEAADAAGTNIEPLRHSRLVPPPEPPADPRRQLSLASAAIASRRHSDQSQARDRAVAKASAPGQESTTVQVSIGRIEVRAAPPAPGAATTARPPAGPSLADYLRHRSRAAGAGP